NKTLKNNKNNNNNYIITNNNANNIIIVNNTFTNNTYDNQDILFSPIDNYTLITNNTYTSNNLETNITGPTNSTGIINIELNTHEYYNTTINTGRILVYDQNNKVIEEYVITDGKISINLSKDLIKSNEYVTITYNSSDNSYQNNSIIVYLAQLIDTYITIDEVNAQVGDTITLRATIKDENNNLVTGGNAVFKINGVSLKSDGSFNSNASVLKLSVNNGVVTYTISADSYLLSANNITLTYSGSSNYYSSSNTTNNISINKKNAQITINSSTTQVRINDTITFTITVTDTSNLPINNGYIILKINGITIRDTNNNTLKIQVINNTATYNYTIPTGSGATNSKGETINYNLTVKYISDEYETISNITTYNVLRTDTKIVVDNIEITNKSMNITARITDTNNNTVTGTNKICIKINGKTLRDSNNNVLYFTIVDGVINLNNITVNASYITNITIVTGQRCCYTASRVTITNL
ncbi:MAG: hypothetical protein LUG89_03100, partial [Methanosphaera sp.]|nr:hypothetical protein [Methanosphaera sp.]